MHGEARTSSGRRNPGRHTSSSVAKYAVQHYQSYYKDLPTANSRVKRSTFHYCACPDFPPDSGRIARGRRRLGFITCRGKFVGGCRHVGARCNGHIWDTAGAVDLFPSRTSHRPRLPSESRQPPRRRRCFATFDGSLFPGCTDEIMRTVSGLGSAAAPLQEVAPTAGPSGCRKSCCSGIPLEVRSSAGVLFWARSEQVTGGGRFGGGRRRLPSMR